MHLQLRLRLPSRLLRQRLLIAVIKMLSKRLRRLRTLKFEPVQQVSTKPPKEKKEEGEYSRRRQQLIIHRKRIQKQSHSPNLLIAIKLILLPHAI